MSVEFGYFSEIFGQIMAIENLKKHLILALDFELKNFYFDDFWDLVQKLVAVGSSSPCSTTDTLPQPGGPSLLRCPSTCHWNQAR
jgi:hypothetical protein